MQLLRDNLTLWTSDTQVRLHLSHPLVTNKCMTYMFLSLCAQGDADETQEAGEN